MAPCCLVYVTAKGRFLDLFLLLNAGENVALIGWVIQGVFQPATPSGRCFDP